MWSPQMMGPMNPKGGFPCMGGMGPPPMWGPPATFDQWGKGKGGKAVDDWPSSEAYVESRLRHQDFNGYKSAGLLLHRKGENGVELLVSLEKPWNAIREDYDPISWNLLGGKRAGAKAGKEWQPQATVARCLLDILGGVENIPSGREFRRLSSGPVLWYPRGKYALFLHEVDGEDLKAFEDLPKRYSAAKEGGLVPAEKTAAETQYVNPTTGQPSQKWTKQIEEVEWVPAADLLAEKTRKPLADLLQNVVEVETIKKFLKGEEQLPSGSPPAPPGDEGPVFRNKGGKSKAGGGEGKSGKGGKGKGFGGYGGGKGFDGGFGGQGKGFGGKAGWGNKGKGAYCKGMQMMPPMPMPHMQLQQMMSMDQPMAMPQDPTVSKQFLGERVYVLVRDMLQNELIAQKVTGMLLELPEAELGPLLDSSRDAKSALKQRVDEAIEVLKQDNFID